LICRNLLIKCDLFSREDQLRFFLTNVKQQIYTRVSIGSLQELMADHSPVTDQETRQRLLDAAARLFAEHGFNKVSVRDICAEAAANVASVNYYFRDKWGLYKEIVEVIINYHKCISEQAHDAGEGKSPEERLRHYIRVFLRRTLGGEGRESCHGKLMAREMADPSPGLDLFVEQAIRPNGARVAALVSELLGCPISDPRVGACVGSIQTQMVGYLNPIASRMVPGLNTSEVIDALAEHIAEFSLGGIRAVAGKPEAVR
jgi:TetR/AcrR family transcriptional regulator, regulator of cefoperazone and chloramphenicol sensitivity